MIRKDLVLAASWLYHNDPGNPAREQIYNILKFYGLHPKTPINTPIKPELIKIIETINEKIKADEAAKLKQLKKRKK